jgi:hypothetical protein
MKITLRKDGTILGSPVVTSPTGYYEFTDLEQGNYSLDIASSHPSGQWQTWSGVNNTDYLLVNKHIAGTQLLPVSPPVVRTAASVKLPHPAINTADATAIRQAAKFPTTGYTYFDTAKWVFSGVDAAHALNNITVGCADVTRDIRGLCSGDVNGTYVPPSGYKMAEPGLELVNQGTLPLKDEIIFPIRVDRNIEIGAITLYLNYEPSLIDITGVEIPGRDEQPWFSANDGVLYVGWISTEPVTMRNNEAILLIHARIANHQSPITDNQSPIKSNPMIRFTLNDIPLSELSDANGNVSGGLILSIPDAGTKGETVKWQNGNLVCYPNPAQSTLNIELETFNLKPETLNLELLNLQGVAVIKQTALIPESSWYTDQLDLREIAPGVYFLRTNVGGEILMKKVVISR